MTLRHQWNKGLPALAAAVAVPAMAQVKDLPGGPGVNQLDLHAPASKLAQDIITMHHWMLIVCLVIFIAVFGVMFYSIFKHRKSKGHQAANFHESVAAKPMPITMMKGTMVQAISTATLSWKLAAWWPLDLRCLKIE